MSVKDKRWMKSAIEAAKKAGEKPMPGTASRGPVARLRIAATRKASSAA
ncbi:hypothetical protein SAMN06297129_1259 [Pseudooceanicola antarcticus]|uniref:Uncharacterized protein n=1 Tax=Pseudooceanicola antarcticus TaxID=1247613 RepID=A0A285IIP2_9RHOB|nr:hypothetical protein [Pseudooceanicola antarcticus]SNY47838.1 hypothetical protein SAMN06297129_1259 [Pseudooceanicola antarcticus]